MTERRAYTVAEFAGMYGLPAKTVRSLIHRYQGGDETGVRAINVGTHRKPTYRIPVAEVARFEKAAAA